MASEATFKPKIIGIICNWCCYGGADLCGVSRFQYPPHIRLIRVMCSARADLKHIFHAFAHGADGMFVGGCHLDDCHYITHGNYEAMSMVQLSKKLLEHIGINPGRLRIEWVSAGEGIRFATIMNAFSTEIQQLGPLGKSEGIDPIELRYRIEEITKLIPYIKLAKRDKLAMHLRDNHAGYGNLYTIDEIDRLIGEAPSYYIDPEKCQGCMMCFQKCPAKAIAGAKKQIHVIDQDTCIKCGTCKDVCPSRFDAVKMIPGKPAPPCVAEGGRAVIGE
jgi:F420-non-reducing hydrogenase iron-sulfur subunit